MKQPVKIETYSHHFVVYPTGREQAEVLTEFSRSYVRWGFKRVNRRQVKTPVAVFAVYPKSRKWFRGHIHQLNGLISMFKSHGWSNESINITEHNPSDLNWDSKDLNVQDGWAPRGEQERVLEFLGDGKTRNKLVTLQTGGGKAQPLSALVDTPTGYIQMGEIEIGTTVLSKNGEHSKVVAIHPQGLQKIFEFQFSGGLKVRATLDHLWVIKVMVNANAKEAVTQTRTTEELLDIVHNRDISIYMPILDKEKGHSRNGLLLMNIHYSHMEEAQCITVDHPSHLYVTNGGILTHNSYVMMQNAANHKATFLLVVRPMFMDKWVIDVKKTYKIKDEEIAVVAGGDALRNLLLLYKEAKPFKAVIISNKTIQNWYKDYEMFEDDTLKVGWSCRPEEMCHHLGAPILNIDEAHMDFHLNFKITSYTHCVTKIDSSATMLPDDPFIKKVTNTVYPVSDKYQPLGYNKYIATHCIYYHLEQPEKIRYHDGFNYSHTLFEKSIRKIPDIRNRYYSMICNYISEYFLSENYKVGYKCLVFCASIDMCTELQSFISKNFPQLRVTRYVEDDEYDSLINMDICVSTVLSAGTAVDVDMLSTVFMTTALSSSQSNTQALGRLRVMKDGHTPEFYWFSCADIQKHLDYTKKKIDLFKEKSSSYKELFYQRQV